jgi:L-lactate dehydrogenase
VPTTNANRIAIIGAGSVGATCAYALLLRRIASEVILTDTNIPRLHAQVQDLSDAAFLSNTKIHAATSSEAGQGNIIVITAGAKQREGDSRRDLLDRNYKILASIIREMSPIRDDAVLLLVSNPVDVLTYFAQKMSGLPKGQVIGSGTFLDTVRLRSLLAEQLQVIDFCLCTYITSRFSLPQPQVADTVVHADVLGEHGDSQIVCLAFYLRLSSNIGPFQVPWSTATFVGSHIQASLPPSSPSLSDIATIAKSKAYSIIAAKGATSYGIASVVSSICESILFDRRLVRPVSHWVESLGTCISLPAVLGRRGVQRTIEMHLSSGEREVLEKSAEEIKKNVMMVDEGSD